MRHKGRGWILLTVIAVLVAAGYALPLVWMAATSVKPTEEITTSGLALLPQEPQRIPEYFWTNYYAGRPASVAPDGTTRAGHHGVLTSENVRFLQFMRNTVIVAVLGVGGMVLSSAIAAYGFSKVRWRGRDIVFLTVLAAMMVPFPATMIATFFIFKHLGWVGTLKPLWAPAWFGGAFNIFLLRQFFLLIPQDLSDAARIDGLSHWGIFWRIILPLARPALAVVAIFHLIYTWNDFLAPLVFLHHQDDFTLALGLQFYQQQHGGTPWNLLMAACTMTVAPLLLLFVLSQRVFTPGLAASGLKE
jgi:multiple sugar transport system permease protein